MISATTDNFGGHRAHFKGLLAILSSKDCERGHSPAARALDDQNSPLTINSLSEVLIVIIPPWPTVKKYTDPGVSGIPVAAQRHHSVQSEP